MPKFTDFKITEINYDNQGITVIEIEIEDDDILECAHENYTPDEIFGDKEELHGWAKENGYIKEEDND